MANQAISTANLSRIEKSLSSIDQKIDVALSTTQSIANANLLNIENSISNINHNIEVVYNEVEQANTRIDATQDSIRQLAQEFREYVRQDQLQKNVQLAETRLVKVRQEIEKKYGHYDEVRRRALGILQAVDISLVRKETIESASEEQLIAAPSYWLAPCLIALSAWINDNKALAEKSVLEALRRDDEKASLFFALVARRGGRYLSGKLWLERYLSQQDPNELKREIVVLIDAFSNGVFGVDARAKCGTIIQKWIEELSQKAGFVEEQRDQWITALRAKQQGLHSNEYQHLAQYSPTWSALKASMEGAKLHNIIFDYFNAIFSKEVNPSVSLVSAVDALLEGLVSEYDEEEQPLKKEERLSELIVNQDGDKNKAQHLFDQEKLFNERVNFTQLLTNFAMYPEKSNASIATQKLAIALSKEWINHAHQDLTAENRSQVPLDVAIQIDKWTGTTRDGSNEEELEQQLKSHIDSEKDHALRNIKLGFGPWFLLSAGIGLAIFAISMPFLFIFAALFILVFFANIHDLNKQKNAIHALYSSMFDNHKTILLAVLSDVVDYRREYSKEDANSKYVEHLLENVSPEHYIYSTYDLNRKVL